jgi:hypothetical protein
MPTNNTLQNAINLAIKNGWTEIKGMKIQGIRKTPTWRYVKLTVNDDGMVGGEEFAIEEIIYNKEFAKALWGEDTQWSPEPGIVLTGNKWKHHLCEMVIADNPLEYLEANIEA